MARGRPSAYTAEIAEAICGRLAAGESLRTICEDDGMPDESTVRQWAIENREGFSPHYARAREVQFERWADEILEIADDGSCDYVVRTDDNGPELVVDQEHINRSRLKVDARKWLLSKLLPKKFGDKLELSGDPERPLVPVLNVSLSTRRD